jgi:hypothetical protein
MAVVLYDLVGRDDRRFSPHCWRTRMALAHKGLAYEARATRFTDIPRIGNGQVKTVPAIADGERLISDSGPSRSISRRPIPSGRRCSAARAARR